MPALPSSSIKMNLPLRDTALIEQFLILRLKVETDCGAISFGRRIALAMIVRPTTARNARTTCSTSGSSGMTQSLSSCRALSQHDDAAFGARGRFRFSRERSFRLRTRAAVAERSQSVQSGRDRRLVHIPNYGYRAMPAPRLTAELSAK